MLPGAVTLGHSANAQGARKAADLVPIRAPGKGQP
jgi:hypothetical protein